MFILFLSVPALCGTPTMKVTADLTADAAAFSGRANLYGVWIVTDGTNSVTFDIYDSLAASGTTLIPTTVVDPNDGVTQTFSFGPPLKCDTGVYVDITTTGTVAYKVYYNTDF